ncbi:protein kinase [Nanoarchaeota archaeon]
MDYEKTMEVIKGCGSLQVIATEGVVFERIHPGPLSFVYRFDYQGEDYVLKISDEDSYDNGSKRHIQRELGILSMLNHPIIVSPLEAGEDWAVYKFLPKVKDNLPKNYNKRIGCVMEISYQILDALAYLHEFKQEDELKPIVHLDVKPDNILGTDLMAMLIDFGLSYFQGDYPEEMSDLAGTPYYTSPERVNGKGTKVAADVWAMGSSVYELIEKKRIIPINTTLTVHQRIGSGNYETDLTKAPNKLVKLVQSMLEREPANRITAREAVKELEGI